MFHIWNFSKRIIEFTYSRFCFKGFTACDFPVETGDFPLDLMAVAVASSEEVFDQGWTEDQMEHFIQKMEEGEVEWNNYKRLKSII